MRLRTYITGIEGIASNGTAIAKFPNGRRYHGAKLVVSGTVAAAPSTDPIAIVEYVRLSANGVLMRDLTPAEILKIAALNGITAAAGELPLFFTEPWRQTIDGQELTSWDVTQFKQPAAVITAEVKFLNVVALAPTLKVQIEYDYQSNIVNTANGPAFFNNIVKILPLTKLCAGGANDVDNCPLKFPIQRVHLAVSANAILSVEITRDGEKVLEANVAENSMFLKDYGIDASQFAFPVVFDYTQQISDALTGVNFTPERPSGIRELNIRTTLSGAATLRILTEQRANGFV
jgi:hypothetical protein